MATVADGRQVVTTAGTRVQLTEQTQSGPVVSLTIQALTSNTNPVVVGGSTVVAAAGTRRGLSLAAGASVTLAVDDLADVWVDAVTSGEGVNFIYTIR